MLDAKFEKKMGAPTKVNGSLDPDTIVDDTHLIGAELVEQLAKCTVERLPA